MRPFKYSRANDAAQAVQLVAANATAKFLAGGTNLLDLLKEDVERPTELGAKVSEGDVPVVIPPELPAFTPR